ncbi:glycosyl transferase family protein [Aliiglaciecola sp. LCG003]|uniref:glycosyl transferase family protein n=1 Tax=Aliiglaciecola sp. LCG003 TaxID=3053655 RepID=UPI0025740BBE|nr:glycosyl transferase family protein [Aliiglaciecola sp. LCG003]WJG11103.1 glycosyl transferase family protein [Aliiglaciecola sp. LCG003]
MTHQSVKFKDYIKAIGRGQRAGTTLSQQDAYQAMKLILENKVTPEQKGAFLMLLRVREETPEELAGFTQAVREHNNPLYNQLNIDLDMGCYAGKRRQLPWFLLSVLVLAQQGKRLFLHGTHEPDSNRVYLADVLPKLGLPIAKSVEQAQSQLNQFGFTYSNLVELNPKLEELIQLRSQFGLRSCANTLARMLNPSASPASLQGVFHRHVDLKHQKSAALLAREDVLCFRGEGGELEYNPERAVTLFISRKNQQGQQIEVPAAQETWQTKPKVLDPTELIDVWSGVVKHAYAVNAIVGTLAIMLVLLENLPWQLADEKARVLWQKRDKTWPFQLSHNTDAVEQKYQTTGKHYSH